VPENYFTDPENYERHYKSTTNNLKVLVFHDLFFSKIHLLIRQNFGKTIFTWAVTKIDFVNRFNPDIVIYEKAERGIDA